MRISGLLRISIVAMPLVACGDNQKAPAESPDAAVTPDAASAAGTAIPLTTPDGSFYTAMVNIGTQTFALDVDTGSTTIGVAGATCTACTGISPLYTPAEGATDSMRTASTQYGDGSKWSGEVFTDMVALGTVAPQVGVGFVNITSQTSFFDGNENLYQGIFGLGPSDLLEPGTTSYLDAVKAAGMPNQMSFELCDDRGTMWLGPYDAASAAAATQWVPMVQIGGSNPFWAVHVTDVGVGGTSLGIAEGTLGSPIVDTGTTLWYMPGAMITALVDQVNASPGKTALFGDAILGGGTPGTGGGSGSGSGSGSGFGSGSGSGGGGGGGHRRCLTAATVTADQVDAMLPELSISFAGGTTLTVPATKSYLEDDGNGRYCLDIFNSGNLGVSILGDRFLRAFVTTIDIPNGRVGFAPDKGCSVAARAAIPREPTTEHGHPPHLLAP